MQFNSAAVCESIQLVSQAFVRIEMRPILVLVLAICAVYVRGLNLGLGSGNPMQLQQYLTKYGYLPNLINSSRLLDESVLQKAISAFQRMAAIPITGKLDVLTKQTMNLPRCGFGDVKGPQSFVLAGKWEKKQLTYKVIQYSSKLRKEEVDRELVKAFNVWEKNSGLSFRNVPLQQPADIDIRFTAQGTYSAQFDGQGGVLAYAYFPQNGDIYFDESENWTSGKAGTSFFHVAVHELGHSLGLAHSNVKRAVMYPFYKNSYYDLDSDDVAGIQKLYGPKQQINTTPTRLTTARPTRPTARAITKPTTKATTARTKRPINRRRKPKKSVFHQDPILCKHPQIDAALHTKNGSMYIFKNDNFWKLTSNGLSKEYPQKIYHYWPGISNIDGAFTHHKKTYFFKGHNYYVFVGNRMLPGYPKFIAKGFDGIPSYVDAVVSWRGRPIVYFFKGYNIYSFNFRTKKASVISRTWRLNGVQAVMQHKNGKTYFFKDNYVYRSDDISYPLPVTSTMYRCKVYGNNVKTSKKETDKKIPFQIPKKIPNKKQ